MCFNNEKSPFCQWMYTYIAEMSFPDIEKWSKYFSHGNSLDRHQKKIITESESDSLLDKMLCNIHISLYSSSVICAICIDMIDGMLRHNLGYDDLRFSTVDMDPSSHFLEPFIGHFEHLSDKSKTRVIFSEFALRTIVEYENRHHLF